ncbi:MAG: hypothetical protein LUE17_09500 [Planctomycetaceae bacterium]|nr:hypothetical protein [Planctomycetaceae bacterium]
MPKQQSKARSLLEYAGLWGLHGLLSRAPRSIRAATVKAAASLWRRLDDRHSRIAMHQMMDRLGLGQAEAEELVVENYRHYASLVAEISKLRVLPLEEVLARTDVNGADRIMKDALAQGRGLVSVTGHLGNWEWGCVVMGVLGTVSGVIARPLDNPYIDNFVNEIRSRSGVAVWSKFNSMRPALAVLRRGEGFVAVVDQDGGRRGYMAPFLGKPGSTMAAPVDMAIDAGAPIYVGAMMRAQGDCRFIIESGRVHRPNRDADPDTERLRLLTAINDDLSAIIRNYPEQWIWIHKRWKTAATKHDAPGS